MNILLYITLFLIGIGIGTIWRSAIYRIPRNISMIKKNITYLDSNKTESSKKLLEKFYLLLGGMLFVIFAKIFNIDANNFNVSSIIIYLFAMSYVSILMIISGIDKEQIKIEKKLIMCGVIMSIAYIVYLYVIYTQSIYLNIICLANYVILLVMDTFLLKRYARNSYAIGVFMLLNIILAFLGVEILIYTLIMTIISILVYMLILKINHNKNGNKKMKLEELPIGYFIGLSNMITLLIMAFITNYVAL